MHIYKITNLITGKVYIGQTTAKYVSSRFSQHRHSLRQNKGVNIHLQRSWNLYGESSFVFEKLETTTSIEKLNLLEIEYIKKYNSINTNFGYNIRNGGNNSKLSEETKRKISISNKGKHFGKSSPMKGKFHTTETKQKMRIASKGRIPPKIKTLPIEIQIRLIDNMKGNENSARMYPEFININTNELIPSGYNLRKMAKIYNLDPSTLSAVINGKRYQHKGWTLNKTINE